MKIFGRDWKEGGYEEIDEFSPTKQAWELLRRKPSYQRDCELVLAFFSWRTKFYKLNVEAEFHKVTISPEDIIEGVIREELDEGASIELLYKIRHLSSEDVDDLMNESPYLFVAKRHNLETKYKYDYNQLPWLPEEELNEEYDLSIFSELAGCKVVVSPTPWEDMTEVVPARHAAVIIDLSGSIPKQLAYAKIQLEIEQDEMAENYPTSPLYLKCREDFLNFRGKIEKDNKAKKVGYYVRILDALMHCLPLYDHWADKMYLRRCLEENRSCVDTLKKRIPILSDALVENENYMDVIEENKYLIEGLGEEREFIRSALMKKEKRGGNALTNENIKMWECFGEPAADNSENGPKEHARFFVKEKVPKALEFREKGYNEIYQQNTLFLREKNASAAKKEVKKPTKIGGSLLFGGQKFPS